MQNIFSFSGITDNEKTIRKTWAEFRQQLADQVFLYSDIDAALQSTFLGVFDDLFQHCYGFLEKQVDNILNADCDIVRAARIVPGASPPDYERFIPKAEFINEDNRFSPHGVEWLYLAFAPRAIDSDYSIAEKCAVKECRAVDGETFALCKFRPKDDCVKNKLIDLTIAKEINYKKLNEDFENACRKVADREKGKYTKLLLAGIKYQPQIDDIKPLLEQWAVYTYAKLLASEIFLPITTEDKSFVYAPFQCMAQYFLQKGYCGIVYSSTVFPKGKNVVLFDKSAAYPYGEIKYLTAPLSSEALAASTV